MTRPINEVGQRRKIQMKKVVNAVSITSVLLLSALSLSTARADMITLKATGTVLSVSGNALSPFQAPWSAVNPGDTWTVTYTFNSSTPNSSFDSSFGQYGPLASYSLTIGSATEAGPSNSGNIQVFGDPSNTIGYSMNGGLASMPGGDFWFNLNH